MHNTTNSSSRLQVSAQIQAIIRPMHYLEVLDRIFYFNFYTVHY
jgi:hypothetical protein